MPALSAAPSGAEDGAENHGDPSLLPNVGNGVGIPLMAGGAAPDPLELAQRALLAGDVGQAKALCRAAAAAAADVGGRRSAERAEALAYLAWVHDLCHETEAVIPVALDALDLRPDLPRPWLLLGMARSRQGAFEEAVAAYARARLVDPAGPIGDYAQALIGSLQKNLACALRELDTWAEAAPWIAQQRAREQPVVLNDPSEVLPMRPLLAHRTALVFDNALAEDLLQACLVSVDDLCAFGLRHPSLMNTYWHARGAEPRTAPEVAGLVLCLHVLHEDPGTFVGFKWWCKNQAASLGAHFHYDCNFELHRPTYSVVLYLAEVGGPTVVLDQYADARSTEWPAMPQVGHLVMPRINRCLVFPGELRHGMVPIDGDKTPRYVLLYNFFHNYTVPAPHCQVPDFSSYAPVCAWAPTRRHLLTAAATGTPPEGTEQGPPRNRVGPLEAAVLRDPEDMQHSCDFGDLPCTYPLPTAGRMRAGSGVQRLEWRAAAQRFLSCL